eukprot:11611510-Ditylum_brightwellii.AAC.1
MVDSVPDVAIGYCDLKPAAVDSVPDVAFGYCDLKPAVVDSVPDVAVGEGDTVSDDGSDGVTEFVTSLLRMRRKTTRSASII